MPVLPDWINFQFPPRVHIEIDCAYKMGAFVKNIGSRVLMITTQKEMQNTDEMAIIKTSIEKHTDGIIIYDDIEDAPSFKDLDTAAHFARQSQTNCIVSYGSFDSINASKAVALLATNDMFAEELIIQKKTPKKDPIPLIVIPTMPAIGLECSPFFTVVDDKDRYRRYFSNHKIFPELIIADAKISSYLTSSDIAKTGTAILAASVDTILSKFSNEITNSSSLRAIELVSKNIITSIRDPKNHSFKNALYAASILTGIAESSSSLGLCFALSLAASSLTKMDVFQAMSILLPHVMEYNLTSS
ncbi:MAG: iron-containing alcohol dehydrogenase, partial [Leptospira sp.]|nr:iron-containing alcohol dehydrogenase [Leptospira sp.]